MPNYSYKNWNNHFRNTIIRYPAESLVRILHGSFPKINFEKNYCDKTALDLGCGSGNNMIALYNAGFQNIIGVDLSKDIIYKAKENLAKNNNITDCSFKIGTNTNIPVNDKSIDFVVSWENIYYMDDTKTVQDNIKELHRVLKDSGYLIASMEKQEAQVYENCESYNEEGYVINKDFNVVMKRFKNKDEIIKELIPYFEDIQIADCQLDFFGKNYNQYIVVCKKRVI